MIIKWITTRIRILIRTRIRRSFILRTLFILFILGMSGCSSLGASTQDVREGFSAKELSERNSSELPEPKPALESEETAGPKSVPDTESKKDREAEAVPENLVAALLPKEVLIDWSQHADDVYALVHSEGLGDYGDTLLVLREKDGTFTRVYENDFRELQPWKIDSADIDGDLEREILVAVRKTTPYDKELKNRMFIFNYQEDVLVKKWTGSQIGGTWRDFYTEDLVDASGEELILLEQTDEGLERIKVYYWFDFGFFLLGESGEYSLVKELIVSGENSLKVTLMEGSQVKLIMKDGRLVEEE